jgi:hypothetical protein
MVRTVLKPRLVSSMMPRSERPAFGKAQPSAEFAYGRPSQIDQEADDVDSDLDRHDDRIGRQAAPILPGPFGRSLTAVVVLGGGSGASPYIRRIARTRACVAHNRAGNPYTSDNGSTATSATHQGPTPPYAPGL